MPGTIQGCGRAPGLGPRQIVLRFPAVDNFDDKAVPQNDLELALSSPFGDLVLTWKPSGQLTWDYRGVKPE